MRQQLFWGASLTGGESNFLRWLLDGGSGGSLGEGRGDALEAVPASTALPEKCRGQGGLAYRYWFAPLSSPEPLRIEGRLLDHCEPTRVGRAPFRTSELRRGEPLVRTNRDDTRFTRVPNRLGSHRWLSFRKQFRRKCGDGACRTSSHSDLLELVR